MQINVSLDSPSRPYPSFEEGHPRISLSDNISIAIKTAWKGLQASNSSTWKKVLKVAVAIPASIVLVTLAITLVSISTLGSFLSLPVTLTLQGWSKQNVKDHLHSLAKEAAASFVMIVTFPLVGNHHNPLYTVEKSKNTPILCVNGYLHNSSAWHYMREKLSQEGVGPIYAISVGNPFESISDKAARVKAMANVISQETGRDDLFLVGHSMGGLVCSEYAATLLPRSPIYIKGVVTLGSPLQGTPMAKTGIGKASRSMETNSTYIQTLQGLIDKVAKIVPLYHFGSKTDMIVPGTSAINHESPAKASRHQYASCGHATFLYSSDVVRHVLASYQHATQPIPQG